MTDRSRNFFVGLTALAGVVGFAYLVFIFGEVPGWVTDTYPIRVSLNHGGGITPGSRVRLNGVDVGQVEEVRLKDNPREGVTILCQIEAQYDIPSGADVSSTAGLLGGAAQLSINTGTDGAVATEPLPRDGTGELEGVAPADFATLSQQLEESVEVQLENFGKLTEKLSALSDQYVVVGERVAAMLEERSVEDVDAGRVQANFTTMMARADARLAELEETIDQVNGIVGDEQVQDDIRQTISNARLFTEDARRLTERTDRNLDTLMRRFVAVADDLSRTLTSVDEMMEQASEGEGTLGRLMNDPALYQSLEDASGRLSDTLREAQLLIEKWKAEGLPVQF